MQPRSWLSTARVSTLGGGLIALGVIGILLPVLPGIIPIAAGISVLARRFTWADRIVTNVRERLPGGS